METSRTPHRVDPVEQPDETLARKLQQGDAQAGHWLIERHSVNLLRYLQRLVQREYLADELHQQTWLSVLEHIDRFDANSGPGTFKSWVYRIATNKAHDLWRSRGRERTAHEGLRLVTDQLVPHAGNSLEAAESVDKLRAAIDRLPDAQKQVLTLRYYSNLKFSEIAEMVGCPLNTALGRMHKAMIRLKELMSEAPAASESREP
jgi:RNA polymerase sigma-70 factor (ECF subfamily)